MTALNAPRHVLQTAEAVTCICIVLPSYLGDGAPATERANQSVRVRIIVMCQHRRGRDSKVGGEEVEVEIQTTSA